MFEYLFTVNLIAFLFFMTLYLVNTFLPKILFRYRLRTIFSKPSQKKEEPQEVVSHNKKWKRALLAKIEKHIQEANLPITAKEFVLIILWGNLLPLISIVITPLQLVFFFALGFNISIFLLLKHLKKRRKKQIIEQLPDVLQLISNALKAGYSFVQTIDLVSKEKFGPISDEFRQLYQALHFGEPFEIALAEFEQRLNIEEITNMVDTLLITRETGGNVTVVIDSLLNTMKENERLLGALKAITAQGRMSAWVVGSLPTGLFVVLYVINGDYMKLLFTHPIGIILVIIAIVLQGVGIFLLNQMVKLKVR